MTSTLFLIVAVVATAVFLIQFIISVFFGDIDADADMSTDIGSVISLKGFTHFCIGMGWFMYLSGGSDAKSYLLGILVGLTFVGVLWFLYYKASQLQKENKPEKSEALLGRECTIYSHDGDRYIVQIAINGALREQEVRSLGEKQYRTGDRATIIQIKSGTLFIQ